MWFSGGGGGGVGIRTPCPPSRPAHVEILTLLLYRLAEVLAGGTIVLRYKIRISYLDQSFLIAVFMKAHIYICVYVIVADQFCEFA